MRVDLPRKHGSPFGERALVGVAEVVVATCQLGSLWLKQHNAAAQTVVCLLLRKRSDRMTGACIHHSGGH